MRQYLIAERIADMRGVAYDRELLLCASFLHDSGLYGPASTGDVYIKDSARYARRTLEPLGWPEHRLRVCLDACEQHHAFRTRWWLPNEVELVRRSDLVEVVPELVRWGIPRSWLKRELWHAVPRAGYWPAAYASLRTRWRRMLPGMFRPPTPRPVGQLSRAQASAAALRSDHQRPGGVARSGASFAISVRRRPRVRRRRRRGRGRRSGSAATRGCHRDDLLVAVTVARTSRSSPAQPGDAHPADPPTSTRPCRSSAGPQMTATGRARAISSSSRAPACAAGGARARRTQSRPPPLIDPRAPRHGRAPPRDRDRRVGLGAAAPVAERAAELPVGPLICVIHRPTRGRP